MGLKTRRRWNGQGDIDGNAVQDMGSVQDASFLEKHGQSDEREQRRERAQDEGGQGYKSRYAVSVARTPSA